MRFLKITALLMVSLLLVTSAKAAEIGIILIPKYAFQGSIQDFIDGIALLKQANNHINLALLGWHELEPTAGTYKAKDKLGGYLYMDQGAQMRARYFGISVINTTRRDISDDLESVKWSDQLMISRFTKLMDEVKKEMPLDLTQFIIGNEVDIYFEKHPDELDDYLKFYTLARAVVHERFPHAVIGASVTYEGLTKNRTAIIARILAASDAAFFTFYPPMLDTGASKINPAADLDRLLLATGNKDVYLQEVGFPSGPAGVSTPELQADFFRAVIPAINARPQIKLATIFALHDFDAGLCDKFIDYYGLSALPDAALKGFQGMLCSLGLIDAGGTPKPSWFTVYQQLTSFGARN